jgi:hypothetical protein
MLFDNTNFILCISVLMMVGVHWRIQINTATLSRDWRGRHLNVPTRFVFHVFLGFMLLFVLECTFVKQSIHFVFLTSESLKGTA